MSGDDARQVPIVLLAAGAGERYGGIKQLALIHGEPMLRRVARTLLETGEPLVVVTGAHAAEVEAALDGLAVAIERHAGWAEGIGSSLAAGIRRVAAGFADASGALLCLADQPLLDADNRPKAKPTYSRSTPCPISHPTMVVVCCIRGTSRRWRRIAFRLSRPATPPIASAFWRTPTIANA